MRPFDPKAYLAEVLAPLADSTDLPDLFERYLLDVGDEDETAIEARLEEVKRYWDKRSEHPRYGSTIRLLAARHPEAKLVLGDARERARLADELRGEQREREEARSRAIAEWDELLDQAVRSAGGLEPVQRARLERMAEATGIAGPETQAKLDTAPLAAEPDVLDAGQRETIARALTDLARDLGEPRAGLSLFHALELGLTDGVEAVEARHAEKAQENRRRAADSTKANWDSVLSLAKIHLLESDPRAYVHGLALDVRKALEPRAIRAVTDDGEIDEVEAEQLRRQAVELGLTPELAQHAVSELAREHGAALLTGKAVDLVACPACNHPHPRAGGAERCQRCGTPLFVECPNECGTKNDATAARCASCGADLHRFAAAARALARLPDLVAKGRLRQAGESLAEAIAVLGRSNPQVAPVAKQVTSAVESAKRVWAEVDAARADGRQYAARRLLTDLERTAADLPGPRGDLPSEALAMARERIGEAEALVASARGLGGEAREQALVDALQLAADCEKAERELEKMPPEPPRGVEAAATGTAMAVRWQRSPSQGVRYLVVRLGAVREVVGETGDLHLDDRRAPTGATVRYSVEAVRGKARSSAAIGEPVSAAYEVAEPVVSSGDGEVRLSWKPPGAAGRVLVSRSEEGGGEPVELVPDVAGLIDRSVVNGRRYSYLVRVEYPVPGAQPLRTAGLTLFAQPVERPRPLENLSPRPGAEGLALDFEPPPAGVVTVLRCREDPELEAGSELDAGRLGELGEALAVSGSTAVDPEPPSGLCFYQAVTVAGGVAVAGVMVPHVSLPEISNVRAVPEARHARVTWSWPDGITLARVVWRHDRQPSGPEDAGARALDYRLGEYRDRGGCSIDLGEEPSLFVAVHPASRTDDGVFYGSGSGKGSRTALRRERKAELRYTVRQAGRLQKKRLEVEVCEPATGALPELLLVGKPGDILPRTPADGEVLARLGGEGPRSSRLELRGMSRPLAVRLFIESASAAGEYVLFDPMADELLIG